MRAPRANAVAERVNRGLRRECLDHVLIVIERHLQAVLEEDVACYTTERPHRGLARQSPLPRAPATSGPVRARPVLGGLHHAYERAA